MVIVIVIPAIVTDSMLSSWIIGTDLIDFVAAFQKNHMNNLLVLTEPTIVNSEVLKYQQNHMTTSSASILWSAFYSLSPLTSLLRSEESQKKKYIEFKEFI